MRKTVPWSSLVGRILVQTIGSHTRTFLVFAAGKDSLSLLTEVGRRDGVFFHEVDLEDLVASRGPITRERWGRTWEMLP